MSSAQKKPNAFQSLWKFQGFRYSIITLIALLVILGGSYLTFTRVLSSPNINYPESAHFHFRLQVIIDGEAADFSQEKFQEGYDKNICSASLTLTPIHFHDKKDQFVHIHWKSITGGQVLKNYGLNRIGGQDDVLGYRWDEFPNVKPQKIHGQAFKTPSVNSKMFVYTGEANDFQKRETNDFLNHTLEDFFANKKTAYLNPFGSLPVSAHSSKNNLDLSQNQPIPAAKTGINPNLSTTDQPSLTEEELKQLNDFRGNVVIFLQETEPSSEQVKEKFNNLIPLPLSSCGG